MQGTVGKVWRNERPDGSDYWVLSIDGKRYSAFEPDLVQGVQPGDRVEFAFTDAGRYRNLTALKRLSLPGFTRADRLAAGNTSRPIVRMNCLRTAAALLQDTSLLPEQKLDLCMSLAQRLEEHVLVLCQGDTGQTDEVTSGPPTPQGASDKTGGSSEQ